MGRDANIGKDPSTRPLQVPPEYGDYAEKARIFDLMEEMTKDLLTKLPADPLAHLLAFLEKPPVPRILVLGPTGSGRRELCDRLAQKSGAVLLYAPDVVMEAVDLESEQGLAAKPYIDAGEPVPNSILAPLIVNRTKEGDCQRNGFIMWGFPQSRLQAMALQSAGIIPTHVFVMEGASVDNAAAKVTGRLRHKELKRVFHSVLNPPPEQLADQCEPVPSPSSAEIDADHARFAKNLGELKATYATTLTAIAVTDPLDDAVAKAWAVLTTRKQTNAPWIPRVVLSGAVGSETEQLGNMLAKKYKLVAVHMRDILLQAVSADVPAASAIRQHLTKGAPLSDSVASALVEARLSQLDCQSDGWVLTGFPSTAAQAQGLESAGLGPNRVFVVGVDLEVAHRRLRWIRDDPISGQEYHELENPSPTEAKNRLHTRPEHSPAAIDEAHAAYGAGLPELLEVYDDRVVKVDGNGSDILQTLGFIDAHLVKPRKDRFGA